MMMNVQPLFSILILSSIAVTSLLRAQQTAADSCTSSFHFLEAALLSHPENRYNLTETFFPPRDANPVIVQVSYKFENSNVTKVFFWSESAFYFIQPLEIFLYTSLFFANQPYRQSIINLELSTDCLDAGDLHMKILTQRLALYAQSATTAPSAGTRSISEGYIAYAASLEEIQEDSLISNFTKVWLHLVLVLFPLLTWLMLYLCDPVNLLLGDKTWQKLDDESTHPVIAALIQVSALFTIFVFVLDWIAFAQTITGSFLSPERNSSFYLSTVTGLLIDFCALGWVVYVLVSVSHWDCKHFLYFFDHGSHEKKECSVQTKKLMSTIMLAPFLCISNHLYYIILAFISDPIHAGFITYAYIITFFLFYFVFRQFYGRVVLRSNHRQVIWEKEKLAVNVATSQLDLRYRLTQIAKEKKDEEAYRMYTENGKEPEPLKIKPRRRILRVPFNTQVVVLGLILIGPILVLYEFMIIMLFMSLPISKSIEAVPTSFFSIYGMGFIIVILLTYSIVLNPSPFSLSKAAEKIGRDLRLPRRYPNWHKFTDEEKFATLVTYCLRHREDLAPSPEPENTFEEGNKTTLLDELMNYDEDIDNKSSANYSPRRNTGEDKPNSAVQIVTLDTETRV